MNWSRRNNIPDRCCATVSQVERSVFVPAPWFLSFPSSALTSPPRLISHLLCLCWSHLCLSSSSHLTSPPPSLPPRSPPCTHPFAPQFVYPSNCLALTSAILSTTHSIKDGSVLHLPSPVSTPSPHLSLSRLVPHPVHFISPRLLLQHGSTKQDSVWLQCDWVLCLCSRPHVRSLLQTELSLQYAL